MRRKKSKFSLFLLFFFLILAYYQMGIEVRAQDIYFRLPSKNKMKNDMEKVFDLNGNIKIGHYYYELNEQAALYSTYYPQEPEESITSDDIKLELWGEHEGRYHIFWKFRSFLSKKNTEWEKKNTFDEACLTIPYSSELKWEAGKKIILWGKSHSWNPLGFLTSPKDPLNEELPQEGIIFLGAQYSKQFQPGPDPLQQITFTPMLFPVQDKINKNYGQTKSWNLAGKLSFLFWNTEIDFCFLKGQSRPDRYGMALSRDINEDLKVYGDFWVIPEYEKFFLDQNQLGDFKPFSTTYISFGSLVGLHYKMGEVDFFVEYLRDKSGYTQEELYNYFEYLNDPNRETKDVLFYTESYYQKPVLMQEYVCGKIIKKKPLGIKNITLSITGILNRQDKSYATFAKLQYQSKPNWKLQLEATSYKGGPFTEFGEKVEGSKIGANFTYFFDFSFFQVFSQKEDTRIYHQPRRIEPSEIVPSEIVPREIEPYEIESDFSPSNDRRRLR